jgi:hypothetical protein
MESKFNFILEIKSTLQFSHTHSLFAPEPDPNKVRTTSSARHSHRQKAHLPP